MEPSAPIITTPSNLQQAKGLKIGIIITSVLAVCGIGVGVYGSIQSSQKDKQISNLKVQIKENDGTVTTPEASEVTTTTAEGETVVTVVDSARPSADELAHYIYIAQWGIKIALPSSLSGISYRYYTMSGYTTLEISGTSCREQGQCQYAPEFSDLSVTNSPLGIVSRFHKDADVESLTQRAKKVTTIGDYDYYYSHPQAIHSASSDEVAWENESVNLIEETLTNPSNYSAI